MIEQGTDEWKFQRLGRFTASEIYALCSPKGLGAIGETYILDKAAEQITGAIQEEKYAKAIEHGNMYEPIAAEYYSLAILDKEVSDGLVTDGFKSYGDHAGCSPDRLLAGEKKGIEIKCPLTPREHLKHLMLNSVEDLKKLKSGSASGKYYWQIIMCMLCYGYDSWDFVSFHPQFTGKLRMRVLTVQDVADDIEFLKIRLNEAIEIKKRILNQAINL